MPAEKHHSRPLYICFSIQTCGLNQTTHTQKKPGIYNVDTAIHASGVQLINNIDKNFLTIVPCLDAAVCKKESIEGCFSTVG